MASLAVQDDFAAAIGQDDVTAALGILAHSAYLVIKPAVDFDPNAAADRAMAAGQQVITQQVDAIQCGSFQCLGGKAVLASVIPHPPSPAAAPSTQPAMVDIPYPRPRLHREG